MTFYEVVKFDPEKFSSSNLKFPDKELLDEFVELIDGVEKITSFMINAVEKAEKYIFTIGGRSRNDAYLEALKRRVNRGDLRYIRVITGDHIRHPLCKHLQELIEKVELGYLKEDKYGGLLVTHNTVILGLHSSRVPSLDKALRILGENIASDYRMYVLELLSNSESNVDTQLIQKLCKTCKAKNNN